MQKNKESRINEEKEISKKRKDVLKCYKEGYYLGELCRMFRLDISSILFLLKKSKLKKKNLYDIYEKQKLKVNNRKDIITNKDYIYIDKFFGLSNELLSKRFIFWKENFKKTEKKKELCKHGTRHIRCGNCNKILADASNIPYNNVVKSKIQKEQFDEV